MEYIYFFICFKKQNSMRKNKNTLFSFETQFSFPEKEELFRFFDTYFKNKTTKIYIALSGWPDSMLLCTLVFYYFFTNSLDMSRLIVCHYNHAQREQSQEEEKILDKYFTGYTFLSDIYTGQKNTEKDLRKARWNFLFSCVQKQGEWYILTWHNLSDRIETTFLNLIRGTWWQGIRNMSFCDQKNNIPILRLLLNISKQRIQAICDQYHIPYFVDASNEDISVSQRNQVRHIINLYLDYHPHDKLLNNFRTLYKLLDKKYAQQKSIVSLLNIKHLVPSQYWQCLSYFSFNLPYDRNYVYRLFEYTNTLLWISRKTLQEFYKFFTGKKGWKYFQGWYFFVSHGKGYAIQAPQYAWKAFREEQREDFCCVVWWETWTLGDFSRTIVWKKNWVKQYIRFPQKGDRYKGKTLRKWMINQKVPLFRRSYVPVRVEGEISNTDIIPLFDDTVQRR